MNTISSSPVAIEDMEKLQKSKAPLDEPLPPPPPQAEQASSTASRAAKKIIQNLTLLSEMVDPYVAGLSLADEGEICRAALKLDEVVELMQSRIMLPSELRSMSKSSSEKSNETWASNHLGLNSERMASASSLMSKKSYPLDRSISLLSGPSLVGSPRDTFVGSSPLASVSSMLSAPSERFDYKSSPAGSILHSKRLMAPQETDEDTLGRRQLLRRFMTPSVRMDFMTSAWKSFGPPRLQTSDLSSDGSSNEDWKDVAREAFQVMDANKDGYLQKQEVFLAIALMKDNHDGFDDSHISDPALFVDNLMEEVDTDGDGQIDFDEFMEMMEKGLFQKTGDDPSNNLPNRLLKITQFARNVFLAQQKKIESNTIGDDMWLIHPMSSFHFAWDILVSILILVIVITIPLSFGWEEFNQHLLPLNLATDCIFLIDLCKTFFTGYIDENDFVVMDARAVRLQYLKGYFTFDMLSSVPLDLIFDLVGLMNTSSNAIAVTKHTLKLLKLFRIAKLLRLRRVSRFFQLLNSFEIYVEEKLRFRISDGFTKVIRLFVGAIVLAHWIGCFNFMLVRMHHFPPDSWVVYAGLDSQPPAVQWTWAFFKALAQMIMIGFETPPFTNASCDSFTMWCQIEHWVTLGCLYIGAVFYSMLISAILSILQTTYLASRHFEEKLIQLDGYMRSKNVPVALRAKVKDHFHFQHANRKFYDEEEVLKAISPIHLKEIRQNEVLQLAEKIPILASTNHRIFVQSLANSLVQRIVFPDQVIFEERTTGDTMYFISSGLVELYLPSKGGDSPYLAIGDGCFFGEVSLLLGVKRTASARAKTQCILYEIGKHEFISLLREFPHIGSRFKKIAKHRRRRLQHFTNPSQYSLAAEDELDEEDRKTDLFGSSAANLEPKPTEV